MRQDETYTPKSIRVFTPPDTLVATVAIGIGLWWAAAWIFGPQLAPLFSEEGPVEQWSDAILLLAIFIWSVITVRRPHWALPVTAYLALLLLEETDWGSVYDLDAGHSMIQALVGRDSLHELSAPGVAIFVEVQHYFLIPAMAFFAMGWWKHFANKPVSVDLPRLDEVSAFGVTLGLYLLLESPLPRPLDDRGPYQFVIYLLFAGMAVRRLIPPRDSSP